VRLLKGPIYEGRFADFAESFAGHRTKLTFAMQIHMTVGVDAANESIDQTYDSVRGVDEKLNMLLLFRQLESPREAELRKIIATKGGAAACMENKEALKELAVIVQAQAPASLGDDEDAPSPQTLDPVAISDLQKELRESVDDSMEKNRAGFERMLNDQMDELAEQVASVMRKETDRVITAFIAGPYSRITDPVSPNGCSGTVKFNLTRVRISV
jgi:hypothetical protein